MPPRARWLLPGVEETQAGELAAALGMRRPIARVLIHRGHAEPAGARRLSRSPARGPARSLPDARHGHGRGASSRCRQPPGAHPAVRRLRRGRNHLRRPSEEGHRPGGRARLLPHPQPFARRLRHARRGRRTGRALRRQAAGQRGHRHSLGGGRGARRRARHRRHRHRPPSARCGAASRLRRAQPETAGLPVPGEELVRRGGRLQVGRRLVPVSGLAFRAPPAGAGIFSEAGRDRDGGRRGAADGRKPHPRQARAERLVRCAQSRDCERSWTARASPRARRHPPGRWLSKSHRA